MSSDFMPMNLYTGGYGGASRTAASDRVGKSDAYQDLIDAGWNIQNQNDMGLDMEDFLQLIVQQFQNQSIDQTASSTDMLNQLVQMSVVQAISQVTQSIATMVDASTLNYAASLVGKEVTVGKYDEDGELQEIVGQVTGTGTYQGLPVIFVNGEQYYLNEIMAIGRLPEKPVDPDKPVDPENPEGEGTPETTPEEKN